MVLGFTSKADGIIEDTLQKLIALLIFLHQVALAMLIVPSIFPVPEFSYTVDSISDFPEPGEAVLMLILLLILLYIWAFLHLRSWFFFHESVYTTNSDGTVKFSCTWVHYQNVNKVYRFSCIIMILFQC